MNDAHYILFYVTDMAKSRDFYRTLLGMEPSQDSDFFVLFELSKAFRLGLWKRDTVAPSAGGEPDGCFGEVAFSVADDGAIDRLHAEWTRLGVEIIQSPTRLGFGYTFVGLDPDGNRLRPFAPAMAPA